MERHIVFSSNEAKIVCAMNFTDLIYKYSKHEINSKKLKKKQLPILRKKVTIRKFSEALLLLCMLLNWISMHKYLFLTLFKKKEEEILQLLP